jgi:hypothetical protein
MVLAIVAGCASVTPVASPAASDAPVVWPSDTSYGQLFSQVQADGTVTKDVALEAFSTAIAPLPGVPDAPGGAPQDFERADGSFAIDWLMPYMDQLTLDQQAAVNAALAPSSTARIVEPARPVAEVGGGLGPPVAPNDASQPYLDAINFALMEIPKRLGRTLKAQIQFDFATSPPANEKDALAFSYRGPSKGSPYCEIRALPNSIGADDQRMKVAMAHEVFHCFQFEMWPGEVPRNWVIEGQAEWAGEDLAGPGPDGLAWWTVYVDTPNDPLYKDMYEAIGFYEHLQEVGVNPWTIFDPMIQNMDDNDAAFHAAHADSDGFLSTWASGYRRTDPQPAAWYAHGRWPTDEHTNPERIHIANGSLEGIKAAAVTNSLYLALSTADITEISADNGNVRMLAGGVDAPDIQQVDLCTKGPTADACNCPEGFDYTGPSLSPSDGTIWLGVSGGLLGASGTVSGLSLTDLCKPTPSHKPAQPRGGPDPCAKGCAGSIGDPHFETLDQQSYDFQAAGEYTLLRSADGSMEIQGRQVPYPDIANVAISTALAWKVAGHRIGMYATQGTTDAYTLMVDGATVDPATLGTMDLGSGAALTALDDGIEVAYGDGTITTALFHGNGFAQALDIQIAPSDTLRAQGVGLLGPLAAGSELPALPDGTALPLSTDRPTQFAQRYQQLAAAWHVTDQTSLFDYKTGETTATFDVPNFPTQDVAFTAAELEQQQDPAAVQNANNACVGATGQPENLQHCIYDILATKDANYAQFYALLTQFLANGPTVLGAGPILEVTVPPPPTPSSNLPAGFVQVASDVSLIKGATIGSDGMLYASILKPDDSTQLVSVDTTNGTPGPTISTTGSGGLFLLDGSLWLAEDDPTGNNKCSLERLDPATLAQQATIPVGCGLTGVQAAPVADGVWWLDGSTADGDGHGGMIRHIDPATNTVDRSVVVPFVSGFLGSSPTTVIYGSSDEGSGWFRLLQGATSFTSMTLPGQTFGLYAQGEGVWFQPVQNLGPQPEADFYTSGSAPDKSIPIDGTLVGANDQAIYVDSPNSNPDSLMRYPFDGSATTAALTGATLTTSNGDHDLGYFDNDPLIIANGKVAKLWLVNDWPIDGSTSVIAQAASTP